MEKENVKSSVKLEDVLNEIKEKEAETEGASDPAVSGEFVIPEEAALKEMTKEERREAYEKILSIIDSEVESKVSHLSDKYKKSITTLEDTTVKDAFSKSEKFSGFGENIASIDRIIEKIRAAMPECVITSDIMVGFPGETDADFEDTMKALEKVRFDMAYEFIYSPREGTPASKEEQIPAEVKSARFDRLLKLETAISTEKNQALVGKTIRVLCDGVSKTDQDVYCGRTEGNKIVFFAGRPEDRGTFLRVRIDSAEGFALRGEIIR